MSNNIFNTVKMTHLDTNVFDMSYDLKLSLNMGELVPVHCQEIIPGDVIHMSTSSLLRFAPLIAPVMHKVDVYTHSFFVPNRLVWENWGKFLTGGDSGLDAPAHPYLNGVGGSPGSLLDYLGLPASAGGTNTMKVSAIPFAAYQLIYNEYYRDQNLQTPVDYELVDGDNTALWATGIGDLRKRAWQHDYFTSALPFAQKGPAVNLPLAGDVVFKPGQPNPPKVVDAAGIALSGALSGRAAADPGDLTAGAADAYIDPNGTLELGGATTINDLRQAFRLQEYYEKAARGGTRLIEWVKSMFGVQSSDARLQRPEYLGGSIQPMIISEVLQTSETATSAQGNMAGHGVSVGDGKNFSYRSEEHGYIITIMSVMPKTAYQQGIPRHFTKFDKFLYFTPPFAHLGEQEILNKEIYYDVADGALNEDTFGYIPRYMEYRYNDSRVAGDFRSTLSYWHMGRIFPSRPALNAAFVQSDPTHRAFAVIDPAIDKIYAHCFHQIKAKRKIPRYGTPTF